MGGKKIVKDKYDTRCQVICVIKITKIFFKEKKDMARPQTKDDLNTYMKSKEGV